MKHFEILERFVVLEGLDGSGTTTQLKKLSEKFDKHNLKCFPTMEPTDNSVGSVIRNALKKKIVIEKKTLALLFAADRNEHIFGKSGIAEYLQKGFWVVSDRYLFSSIAYQSLDCEMEWVTGLNEYPLPEFLFFIDIDPGICHERMKSRDNAEMFDDLSIQNKIISNYKHAISLYSGYDMKIHMIDGTDDPDTINEKIWKILDPCRYSK